MREHRHVCTPRRDLLRRVGVRVRDHEDFANEPNTVRRPDLCLFDPVRRVRLRHFAHVQIVYIQD